MTAVREAAVTDPDELVRATAARSATVLATPLVAALDDAEPLPRLVVAATLLRAEAGDTEALVAAVERDAPACLRTVERLPGGRNNALSWALDAIGPRWELRIRLLNAWLRHPGHGVRETACMAAEELIRTWAPAADALTPALNDLSHDPVDSVRDRALWTLIRTGRVGPAVADALWSAVQRGPVVTEESDPDSPWGGCATSLGAAALAGLTELNDPRADRYRAAVGWMDGRPPASAR